MATQKKAEKQIDYYMSNSDWSGRQLFGDREIVKYRTDSSIRIWFNEQEVDFAPHWHNAVEIISPVENTYDAIIGDTTYHLQPGEILVIPSGSIHALDAPSTGKRFIFMFDLSVVSRLNGFSNIESIMAQPLFITNSTYPYNDLYRLLMQISNEYFGMNAFRDLTIYSLLINFFVHIGNNHINNTQFFPNVRVYKQKEYIQKFNDVMDYIDSHYMDELTLEDVASTIGFSKYHFTRLFKQYTNTTFYDYLSFKRIKVAESLLIQPDLSITEIALQSGFSSISTFNRSFKQQKNCTPSEYRSLYSTTSDPFS